MEVMSEQHAPNAPYKTLGNHLRYLREQSNETLAEVSGAVEIDEQALNRIESGQDRPAEDILLLMITHFSMSDHEAVQLWELAGYTGSPEVVRTSEQQPHEELQKAIVMFMAVDARTIYTDSADISCNQAGVTMSFAQTTGQNQANIVSRVGMSYEQAAKVSEALQMALLKAQYLRGPKSLPPNVSPQQPSAE
jgi:transcriptional regulator with XRE-family HTH domain